MWRVTVVWNVHKEDDQIGRWVGLVVCQHKETEIKCRSELDECGRQGRGQTCTGNPSNGNKLEGGEGVDRIPSVGVPLPSLARDRGSSFRRGQCCCQACKGYVDQCWTLVLAASTSIDHANSWMKMVKGVCSCSRQSRGHEKIPNPAIGTCRHPQGAIDGAKDSIEQDKKHETPSYS